MSIAAHWEKVFQTKQPDEVSWYRPHLELSLDLIQRFAPGRSAPIIDVGAGESTLVDDLLALGYESLTVLDVSHTAIEATKMRLGEKADVVQWLTGDVTEIPLAPQSFEVWHDRAV